MKNVLVTGGAGFIGSNFIRYLLEKREDVRIVNLDVLTYAGNLRSLSDVESNPRYAFVKGDVRDAELVRGLLEKYDIDAVVNFAAESHVDRSILEPDAVVSTNVLGTVTLLDAAKRYWKLAPEDKYSREYRDGARFLQISTDEVYGALGKTGFFTENTPLNPSSPYSASKASADFIAKSYYTTFGFPALITRCSNNYGPYQFPEKLIPLMIRNASRDMPLPIYGDGMQIRDWLHVEDHCSAILAVLERGVAGEVYNIGGGGERPNLEIAKFILRELNKPGSLIKYVADRPGHDRRYAIDSSKLRGELGWTPLHTLDEGLRDTVRWYTEHTDWLDDVTSGGYMEYYGKMYG